MTPDQLAALEILLDAQRVLDTDTQLMPLIRFVLFGTTGDEAVEPVANIQDAIALQKGNAEEISLFCPKRKAFIAKQSRNGIFYPGDQDVHFCPNCGAKFK